MGTVNGAHASDREATDGKIDELRERIFKQKQELARLYRNRPAEPIRDYELVDSAGTPVRLSELFGEHDDLILVHNMGKSCFYCTMWADGFVSSLRHLTERAAFVVSSPDTPETQASIKNDRGWSFTMVSTATSSLTSDLGYQTDRGLMPGVSALHKNPDGTIVRAARDYFGPYDDYNPVWNLFNLLQGGAGDWQPTPPE